MKKLKLSELYNQKSVKREKMKKKKMKKMRKNATKKKRVKTLKKEVFWTVVDSLWTVNKKPGKFFVDSPWTVAPEKQETPLREKWTVFGEGKAKRVENARETGATVHEFCKKKPGKFFWREKLDPGK